MTTQQPAPLTVTRIIAGAMVLGVVMLWIIVWVLTEGGTAPKEASSGAFAQMIVLAWYALAAITFAAALYLHRSVEGLAQNQPAAGLGASRELQTRVQGRLVLAWALLEAPAILGGVAFLLFGTRAVLYGALPIFLLGMALTFPRADWFGA